MPTKTYWIEENLIMAADHEGHIHPLKTLDKVMHECTAVVDERPCYFLVDTLKMSSIQPSFP
ncbi:MAG: hypothetical protein R3E39_24960 [Anaerolineae bacterium]